MAHNVRVRETGAWVAGPLYASEMDQLDEQLYSCISETGGSYLLGSNLTVGGAYSWIFASATAVIVNGDMTIGLTPSADLYVDATSHFSGPMLVNGGVTIATSGTFSCSRAATFSGGVTITTANITVTSDTDLQGDATLGIADTGVEANRSDIVLLGNLILGESPVGSNPGRIKHGTLTQTMTGNISLSVSSPTRISLDPGGVGRVVTLLHAGATGGEDLVIANIGTTADTISVADETAGFISLGIASGGVGHFWYESSLGRWVGGVGQNA